MGGDDTHTHTFGDVGILYVKLTHRKKVSTIYKIYISHFTVFKMQYLRTFRWWHHPLLVFAIKGPPLLIEAHLKSSMITIPSSLDFNLI